MTTPRAIAELSPGLDAAIRATLKRHGVPGASVAVVRGCDAFLTVFGVKHLGGGEEVGAGTAFNIGSTSKALAAAAVSTLAARGVLSWDDPVRTYIPDFGFGGSETAAKVTLRDLSANRAGLPRTGIIEFGSDLAVDADELVRRTRFVAPVAPLGSRFTYSNIGHVAVALAASRAAGSSYQKLLEETLFRPLGMTGSATGTAARSLGDRAGWHCALDGRTIAIDPVFTDVQIGAAGVCMSGADALRWLRFLLGDGTPLMPPASLAEMFTPHVPIGPDQLAIWIAPPGATDAAYALGWAVARQEGRRIVRHSGSDFGMNAHISLAPDNGYGAAVFVNKDCKASVEINYMVMEVLAGVPPRDWSHIVSDGALPDTNATFLQAGPIEASPMRIPGAETLVGAYENSANGRAVVSLEGGSLQIRFEDAPLFHADLRPAKGDGIILVPRYPGLVSDSVGATFLVTPEIEDGQPVALDIRGIGRFRRAGAPP